MPSVATIIKMIRQESPARLEMGTVVSVDARGIRQVTVRLSGGRTISRPYMCVEDLEVGDPVIVAHMEGLDRMVVISRVLDAYSSDLAEQGVLAPPSNLAVTGYPMAIHTEWENYPGEGLSYIVEESDDAGVTGTQMLVTQGSYYLHLCTVEADHAPETWHFRVRSLRWLGDNNVQYSSWSDWTSGTSKVWDARYYTEAELSSADCDGLHGASLIWICDADENFPSTVSDVELALDYIWDNAGGGNHNDLAGLQGGQADQYYHMTAAQHTALPPAAVAQGDILYADNTPAWVVLPRGNANFIVRISGGNIPEWVDPQLEIPIACALEGQVIRSDGLPKWEATTTPHWPGQWHFAAGLNFEGASGLNILYVPTNTENALEFADGTTGDEYISIRTSAQKSLVVNENGEDIDFTVEASGVADALVVQGSDGQVTLGVLGAGHLSTSAAGVVSASTNIVMADGAWVGADAACALVYNLTNSYVSCLDDVAVGTATPTTGPPAAKFHVDGIMRVGGGTRPYIYIGGDADGTYIEQRGTSASNEDIRIQTSKSGDWTNYIQVFFDPTDGMAILSIGTGNCYLGVGTALPSQIVDCNDGSGNMIADGYDNHPSWLLHKEDPRPMGSVLEKFKQVTPYEYRRVPYVSAEELAAAAKERFGLARFNLAFPDGYRGGKLQDCPDPEILAFLDQLGDQLRAERRELPEWQRLHYSLAMDDLVDTFPDILSRNEHGEVSGYSLNSYVGLLHACIAELLGRVEQLEVQ